MWRERNRRSGKLDKQSISHYRRIIRLERYVLRERKTREKVKGRKYEKERRALLGTTGPVIKSSIVALILLLVSPSLSQECFHTNTNNAAGKIE